MNNLLGKIEIKFFTNYQISKQAKYLENIKEILISNNNNFIPSLYERIEVEGTLEEKVNHRVSQRLEDGYHYILSLYEDEVVGFTELRLDDSEVQGRYFYAINVGTSAISDKFQGRGIAKMLYGELETLAREFKVEVVLRSTWSKNEKQLRLYEKFGYSEIERIKDERGVGNDLLKFCKWF